MFIADENDLESAQTSKRDKFEMGKKKKNK